jgi:hypothetical protein
LEIYELQRMMPMRMRMTRRWIEVVALRVVAGV